MKDTIISIFILIAVATTSISVMSITSGFCNDLSGVITECMNASKQEDWKKAQELSSEALSMVEKKGAFLKTTGPHEDVTQINNFLYKIDAAVAIKSVDICVDEGHSLIGYLRNLAEADTIRLTNIL